MKDLTRKGFLSLSGSILGIIVAPTVASAKAGLYTRKTGLSRSGSALTGLINMNGKTYCYSGGVLQKGLVDFDDSTYYFDKSSGEMQTGVVEIDTEFYHFDEVDGKLTHGLAVASDESKVAYLSDDAGVLESPGVVESNAYTEDGSNALYLVDSKTHGCALGWSEFDGKKYCANDKYQLYTNCVRFDDKNKTYGKFGEDGACTRYFKAKNIGGWDFTDWDYAAQMLGYVEHFDSYTNWSIVVDANTPVRAMVFHRDTADGDWYPCCGWYCGIGRRTYSLGLAQGCVGPHFLRHRWANYSNEDTVSSCVTDYIECYGSGGDGERAKENDASAQVHGSWPAHENGKASWGYGTHSCVSLRDDRSAWVYYNMDWFSTIIHIGENGEHGKHVDYDALELGVPGGWNEESDLMPWAAEQIDVEDPFGLGGDMPSDAIISGNKIPQPDGSFGSTEDYNYKTELPFEQEWPCMTVGEAMRAKREGKKFYCDTWNDNNPTWTP